MKYLYSFLIIVFASFQAKAQCVNFKQYQPAGWDASVVVSAITGTNTSESGFYFNQTLYLDIAIINNGTCNASQTVKANVFLDGVFKTTMTFPVLNSNFYGNNLDFMISGSLAVGNHTIQVDIDNTNVIAESNESDNTFYRYFTVQQGACVAASVNTVFNGNRTFNTEHYQDNNFRIRDQCQTTVIQVRDWNNSISNPNPVTTVEIVSPNNSWTNQTQRFGGTVMWAAKSSYNYFSGVHSRNSYNGTNGLLDCFVNSVFWNGTSNYTDNATMSNAGVMSVGLGSSGTLTNSWCSLDIIGHEFTHAVTGSSAALVYQNESGALNESFSDIFGECIENYTLGSNDWIIGGDRTSGAIRSMWNPNVVGDPDTYLGTNWVTGSSDNGGVHTNSGVQNLWFYLLSQGGTGTNDNSNAYNVTGIGLAKARAIAFRTLTVNLFNQPNANYATARTASIQSADDIYGANSVESNAVKNAWCAVGIGVAPSTVSVSGGGTFCNSTTVTASGGAAGTIYWQGTNSSGTSTSTPSTSQTINSSGTYYFRALNGCGWSAAGSVTVVINTVPSAVTVSGGGTFCNSATITASGGSGGTIYFQGTIPNGTFFGSTLTGQTANGSGTYYFRSYNPTCGWGTQGSATVTIANLPTAVSVDGAGTFCNSTTISATGGSGGTIYWQGTNNGGTSAATPSTSQVVSSSGTYYFRAYNSSCGWGSQGSVSVIINTTSAVSVYGGGTFCNSANLSAISANGGTIYWQGATSGGTSTSYPIASQISVAFSGINYFRVLNSCGWGPESSVSVIINTVPGAVTVGGGGTYYCSNSTLTATGGSGGTIYWQGTSANGTSISYPSTSQVVGTSGTYYFRAENGCGWGAQGSAAINIITNMLLSGTATGGLEKAGQTISSSQIIPSGATVNYQAGNSISLTGTFTAQLGSVFKAEIKACNNL